jgi:hypothetical protein
MVHVLFLLPSGEFTLEQALSFGAAASLPAVVGLGLAVLILLLIRLRRWLHPWRRPVEPAPSKTWILVDGSNVMHWQDNTPQLAPVLRVIEDLQARGFAPGVVFDANAGHKLFGKYLNERDLSRMLTLPVDQVLVVPKGTPADPYILDTARAFKAQIVTNDRYRDWATLYPEVAGPDLLIWGGFRDGKLWLRYPDLTPGMARAMMAETVG